MTVNGHRLSLVPRSPRVRVSGVICSLELLFASAYVPTLIGWLMLIVACGLLGLCLGALSSADGLREHRQ